MRLRNTAFLLLLFIANFCLANEKSIRVVGSDWCPYACDVAANDRGIVIDITSIVLEKQGYQVEYFNMPWNRAETMINFGNIDALAGIAFSPMSMGRYRFPDSPLAEQIMCFYQRKSALSPITSLPKEKSLRMGWINGYGYGIHYDIDRWIRKNKNQVIAINGSDTVHARLQALLVRGRIDFFIADQNIINYQGLNENISESHCLEKTQGIFIGFSRAIEDSQKLVEDFNNGLKDFIQTKEYENLLDRYNIAKPSSLDVN